MRLLLTASFLVLTSAFRQDLSQRELNYMYYPDERGIPHIIDLKQTVPNEALRTIRNSAESVVFKLYTPTSPNDGQILTKENVHNSMFEHTYPTSFIIHGWKSNANEKVGTLIREAYLDVGNYNVITVDWSYIASMYYIYAVKGMTIVAEQVALIIEDLEYYAGLDKSTVKIIGHSLGAHIAGLAARSLTGNLKEIVGLDPALPLITADIMINAKDGEHVQIIHTAGAPLAIFQPLGTSDFYPNGGKSQPGCGIDFFSTCAHSRAYYYFAESIRDPTGFHSIGQRSRTNCKKCSPENLNKCMYTNIGGESKEASSKLCSRCAKLGNNCKKNIYATAYMGGSELDPNARGSYELRTASSPPFALKQNNV
ncbi:phospholipase A1 [Orussus abietinus]|uniref:phospholipase A1 n=1 Tax=Orussus abietinus TaxID=222816 RepID=UPI000625A85C|nr:phospholipase A1 [Orussus abietinus]